MTYFPGKTLVVTTLLAISAVVAFFLLTVNQEQGVINSTALNRSGIKNLNVEYNENKIYLNVELVTPQTCHELINSLDIRPIVIKSKIYRPNCLKISDTLIRITYTKEILI